MHRYLIRRLLLAIPTLIGVVAIVFFVIRLVPGDPAVVMAGESATEEDIARIRERLGTDQPIIIQFARYLGALAVGDLGISQQTGAPVLGEIIARLPVTVTLALGALAVSLVLGVIFGVLSARREGGVMDVVVSSVGVLGLSMPVFWVGLIMILVFAVALRWLPTGGIDSPGSLVLPIAALSMYGTAVIARVTRSSVLESMGQDYVRTARAKGASRTRVLFGHALRNSAVSIVTIAGLMLGAMLGGAVMTESVFSLPGLGRLLVGSIMSRDFPVIQGVVLTAAILYVTVTIAVDLLYAVIDPKVSYD